MLLMEKFLDQYSLATVNGHIDMPTHIKTWPNQKKLDWLRDFLRPLIDGLIISFHPPNTEPVYVPVIINNQFNLIHPPTYHGKDYEVTIGAGAVVRIPIPDEPSEVTKSANFFRHFLVFRVF